MNIFLTPKKVAEKLGVSEMTIYRYIKAGKLKAIKLSERNFRIDEKDLSSFLKEYKGSIDEIRNIYLKKIFENLPMCFYYLKSFLMIEDIKNSIIQQKSHKELEGRIKELSNFLTIFDEENELLKHISKEPLSLKDLKFFSCNYFHFILSILLIIKIKKKKEVIIYNSKILLKSFSCNDDNPYNRGNRYYQNSNTITRNERFCRDSMYNFRYISLHFR